MLGEFDLDFLFPWLLYDLPFQVSICSIRSFFFNFHIHGICSEQCFMDSSTRRPADLLSSFATIKSVMNNLYDGLAEILRSLLKNTNT